MIPSDDGSDSAPEDISFSQSKQEAVDSLSNALKQMQERRRKIKDKRRKHNDLLNDQKKKKLLKLQEKKLSADFLKQVSETSFQKSTAEESVEESKETDPAVHHQHFEEDGGEMEEDEGATLIADRFYVMSKQRAERKPHPISANAVSFLQQSLYGRHMNRRPVVNVLATEAKLHQRPADNFKVSKAKKKRRGYKRRPLPIS
ncbi:hypothetical protein BSL78_07721 [Apostichopus japonicus]|uniref:Nucleolar protein 7 n=1 Tax=Stichopus japonicus TaxID=307972 RepID=A0A2G8L526_STIJA|nr:hypothetical protein BSL78_07721 [Apostichopus japonicus]